MSTATIKIEKDGKSLTYRLYPDDSRYEVEVGNETGESTILETGSVENPEELSTQIKILIGSLFQRRRA